MILTEKEIKENENKFLTQSSIAKIFKKDRQRINTLIKTGKLFLNENKKINFNDALIFFENEEVVKVKKTDDSNNKKNGSIDEDANYNQVLIYKLRIEAKTKELELRKKENELIEKDNILKAINLIGSKLKEGLISLPNRISPIIAIEQDERVVNDILNKEIRRTLDSIIQELKNLGEKNEF